MFLHAHTSAQTYIQGLRVQSGQISAADDEQRPRARADNLGARFCSRREIEGPSAARSHNARTPQPLPEHRMHAEYVQTPVRHGIHRFLHSIRTGPRRGGKPLIPPAPTPCSATAVQQSGLYGLWSNLIDSGYIGSAPTYALVLADFSMHPMIDDQLLCNGNRRSNMSI
jgi:hypothetical protein